ncbi:zinc transporter foi [Episyrphus balteatus]|uniref:zinc transporter foi n=1 Tax=Episyrphus balteatus TaxID=286459 RepID=UPI0024862162|nr:zinc transporter foi [Episyrphus balteatus]XP_055840636.1 zinc transporter foi [Episyrphus balteatus]XP_055840637.1 zinc transporter foi [Episyrphus balteatus]XP_055840638.1 zinc transporter foi [Episyrphus balteatus]
MARHIMAVCVVCLLCAEHLPCEEHIESVSSDLRLNAKVFHGSDIDSRTSDYSSYSSFQHSENHLIDDGYDKSRRRRKNTLSKTDSRSKRHAGHHNANTMESQHKPEITEDFMRRIFQEHGQEDGTININQFENMLKKLGLFKMVEEKASNESCASSHQIVDSIKHHHQEDHNTKSGHKCMSDPYSNTPCKESPAPSKESISLDSDDLINLCPVLLYQLASNVTLEKSGCVNSSLLFADNLYQTLEPQEKELFYVWTYSFLSVLGCGLLGLIGVAIIPFMDSRYYKHIIQYLVSLAVGTMTGDALLHLLPHSLAGQTESNMVYKGLTCMGGIIFFYITEHGLTMISEWRKGREKKDTQTSRAKVVRDPESSINNSVAGDKLCKSKYSSYPYCYDEIAMDTKNDVWLHLPNPEGNDLAAEKNSSSRENGDANETAQSLLSQNYTPISDLNHRIPDSNTISTNLDDTSLADGTTGGSCGKDKPLVRNDTVTVILREHESSHHGHSHKHGHVHSPPESLSAVAWMIIMGDGLHNFTDGMAIGAAFADNIAGGCSTSLAVFCHELPHELGDFAILIKAGMSVKSAVYYNLLTGILSFIGMIFGILFGQSQEAAQWMFAAAAGLFIYIALVDMMPELSAAHKTLEQFALQIFGMSTGVFLMLLIAVNENRLMTLFSPNPGEMSGHSH